MKARLLGLVSAMLSRAVAGANTAAQRLHARLHTDYAKPIDVFAIVQEEGVWLASKSLGAGLYGFYLREGNAAGIVLNSEHPENLQRYTCAHELGHHILGHTSHLDQSEDIDGPTAGNRLDEVAAQAFAGAFLMPLQAVNRVRRRLAMAKNRRLDATDVYAISRELDVSFSAAAWQLAALGQIPVQDADRFAKSGPKAAKHTMRPGPSPAGDNRAALFILDPRSREVPILCRPGDELRLRLPENASTGHVWKILSPFVPETSGPRLRWDGRDIVKAAAVEGTSDREGVGNVSLRLAQDNYLPGDEADSQPGDMGSAQGLGQPGTRELVFLAEQPGRLELTVRLSRPWLSGETDTFSTPVRIGPAHTLVGFAESQARAHVARVAGG